MPPVQLYPVLDPVQFDRHPGFIPASHISVPTTHPSPQTVEQIEGELELLQVYPIATPEQSTKQPDKAPASQTSAPQISPSPQCVQI